MERFDGMVSGAPARPHTIVPSFQIIKTAPASRHYLPHGDEGPRVGIWRLRRQPQPDARNGADIAVIPAPAASSASPRVAATLSYSTGTSKRRTGPDAVVSHRLARESPELASKAPSVRH